MDVCIAGQSHPMTKAQISYVAIEMMLHSLPITVSTTTGLKEMIVDGETGFHIPVIESVDSHSMIRMLRLLQ